MYILNVQLESLHLQLFIFYSPHRNINLTDFLSTGHFLSSRTDIQEIPCHYGTKTTTTTPFWHQLKQIFFYNKVCNF
jgi:hypothetical protein